MGLSKANSQRFRIGGFAIALEVFEELSACIPQFWATWLVRIRCCAAGPWLLKKRGDGFIYTQQLNGLHIPNEMFTPVQEAATFEAALQVLLNAQPDNESSAAKNLSSCPECKDKIQPQSQHIILDRPPYTICLCQFNMRRDEGDKPGMYEDVSLTFSIYDETGSTTKVAARATRAKSKPSRVRYE